MLLPLAPSLSVGVLTHAFGERYELPLPLWLFATAGAVVVLASFLLVLRSGVRSGESTHAPEAQFDEPPHVALRAIPATLSLALTAAVAYCGFTGTQETAENIAPLFFWVVLWIAVPLSCGLVGDWTRSVNPFAALARIGDSATVRKAVLARRQPLSWPRWLGWWPAVALFVVLVLGELVFNLRTTTPAFVGGILACYGASSFVLGLLMGPAWLARGEVFTVLFDSWGRLGYFRFGAQGRRGFTGGLDSPFARSVSRLVFVLLMLVSINFDGLLSTPQWASYERRTLGTDVSGIDLLRTLSLAALLVVVLAAFMAFAIASARTGRHEGGPVTAFAGLLPSLVPIAFGYLVAHYLQYLVTNLQFLAPLVRHPRGPVPDDFSVDRSLLPNSAYWYISVAVIVGAHVVAVVIAHRHLRARAVDPRAALRSEFPWLVAMVAYTAFSLVLIAQPLTQEHASATQVAATSGKG